MIRFTLVISDDLNDWLKEQASKHNRSKNQHITHLLQSIRDTAEDNQMRLSKISPGGISDRFMTEEEA